MTFAFDLISDLHLETWEEIPNWEGMATSPFCVIAGDVCRDRSLLKQFLTDISKNYRAVFYIDGNDEHRYFYNNLNSSYDDINRELSDIDDLVYMQDNVVIIDGIAFLGTNAWWDYAFDPLMDPEQSCQWCAERYHIRFQDARNLMKLAQNDARYLAESIKKLQTHADVKKIVVVTHTVPLPGLINFDLDLVDNFRFNSTGNSLITECLQYDLENKISTWCFGHYHGDIDIVERKIRWVSNPRGRGDTKWSKSVYFPKRIVIS